jgi:hypothetical protein
VKAYITSQMSINMTPDFFVSVVGQGLIPSTDLKVGDKLHLIGSILKITCDACTYDITSDSTCEHCKESTSTCIVKVGDWVEGLDLHKGRLGNVASIDESTVRVRYSKDSVVTEDVISIGSFPQVWRKR